MAVGNSLHVRAGGGFEFRFAHDAANRNATDADPDPDGGRDARTVSAMATDLRRTVAAIRTGQALAARIAGPLAASTDELRAETDLITGVAAQIRACIADHAAPGPAGGGSGSLSQCIPLVASCAGLPGVQGKHPNLRPDLARLQLEGHL